MAISALQALGSFSSQYSVMQSRLQPLQAAKRQMMDARSLSSSAMDAAATQAVLAGFPLQQLNGIEKASTARIPQDQNIGLKDARQQTRARQTDNAETINSSDNITTEPFASFLQQRSTLNLGSQLSPQISLDSGAFLQIFAQISGENSTGSLSTLSRLSQQASQTLQRNFAAADENSIDIAA